MTSGETTQLVAGDDPAVSGLADGAHGAQDSPTAIEDRKQSDILAKAAQALTNVAQNMRGGPVVAPASGPLAPVTPLVGTPTSPPNGVVAPPPGGAIAPPIGAASPTGPTAPPSMGAPAAATPAPPGIDPETIAEMAPTALAVGSMALPMVASALAGLAGDGSGSTASSAEGLSPEAQRAMETLKTLAALYGDDGTESRTGSLGSQPDGVTGSGAGVGAIRARALFQKNAARSFNNLDNDLAEYIQGLAGSNRADKQAIIQILREVDVQLAELGPAAYTKDGQRQVHQILTVALQKAQSTVRGGQANASDTAAVVNQLTAQYLNDIVGRRPASTGGVRPGNGRPRSPLDPGTYRISSKKGPRGGEYHDGVDLAAAAGTPIYAATGGKVFKTGNSGDGYGYQVRIRAPDGTETIYAHQQAGSIRVEVSDEEIPAGTLIGAVGSTGDSTGPHLHYEVRRNGRVLNPIDYLAANNVQL